MQQIEGFTEHLSGKHNQKTHAGKRNPAFTRDNAAAIPRLGNHIQNKRSDRARILDEIKAMGITVNTHGLVKAQTLQFLKESLDATPELMRRMVKTIDVHAEDGPPFTTPDGVKRTTGADWYWRNSQIRIFSSDAVSSTEMDRILYHELGHAHFDSWFMSAASKENSPNAKSVNKFLDGWQKGEDGVTPYSKAWNNHTETVAELNSMFLSTVRKNRLERDAGITPWLSASRSLRADNPDARTLVDAYLDSIKDFYGPKWLEESAKIPKNLKYEPTYKSQTVTKYFNDAWEEVDSKEATNTATLTFDKRGLVTKARYGKSLNSGELTEHLQGKHDQKSHGHRGSGKLEVYAKPEDFEQMSKKELQWAFGKNADPHLKLKNGGLITGRLVKGPEDLPPYVYHVTTKKSAVDKSIALKGFSTIDQGGLGGGTSANVGVSFTKSLKDAAFIKREIQRQSALAKSKSEQEFSQLLKKYQHEDERISGLKRGTLDAAYQSGMDSYKANKGDWESGVRSFRIGRSYRGGPDDPIILGSRDYWEKFNPKDIGVVKVPSKSLFASGGAVVDYAAPSDFLHEVRVMGQVPLAGDLGRKRQVREAETPSPRKQKIQRKLYKQYKRTSEDQKEIADFLFQTRLNTYNTELTRLARMVGAKNAEGELTNKQIRSKLLRESKTDAESIVKTFNRQLRNQILREETDLEGWLEKRSSKKSLQISQWTINKTRAEAAQEFFKRNKDKFSGKGSAVLFPRTAKESICQGWVRRGRVPLEEALNNPPPYHLNCPHTWNISPPKLPLLGRVFRKFSNLWLGE